jgi:hypothetical protein
MRQLLLAAGVLCAAGVLAHWASAQNQAAMPGQVVGSGFQFNAVGNQFPQAGTKVGQPVNLPPDTPLMRRSNPNDPFDVFRGTKLDPRNVAAPFPGGDKNALERFYDKLKSAVGLSTRPSLPPPQMVTPGIFRRNRERAEERMWRRD